MPREKVDKTVAQRVEAGFVTDVIVIFEPHYRKAEQRILEAREPAALPEKIRVLEAAVMQSLDVVAGALLRRNARLSMPGVPVAMDTEHAAPRHVSVGSGVMVSSWLANSVSFLASPDWIRKLASNRRVVRVLANRPERHPEPFRSAKLAHMSLLGDTAPGLEHLKIPALWKRGLSGRGVRIGHLDTGVDATHPDLKGKVAGWEAFDQFGQKLTGTPIYDSAFHGTHTAGILVGGQGSGTAIGVAPEARLVSALVLPQGNGTTKQIVTGMEWCVRQGARIINLSLGGPGYNDAYEPTIRNLTLLGVLPSFSIGNSGLGVAGSPANHRDACAVGAVNERNEVADFSGGGAFVWGTNDVYVKPDLCAPGVAVYSSIPMAYVEGTGDAPTDEKAYDSLDGTSMAAPHVSGTAALLWEALPQASLDEMKTAIYSTCLPLGPSFHNMHSGRGLLQPGAALRKLEKLIDGRRARKSPRDSEERAQSVETIGLPPQTTSKVPG